MHPHQRQDWLLSGAAVKKICHLPIHIISVKGATDTNIFALWEWGEGDCVTIFPKRVKSVHTCIGLIFSVSPLEFTADTTCFEEVFHSKRKKTRVGEEDSGNYLNKKHVNNCSY